MTKPRPADDLAGYRADTRRWLKENMPPVPHPHYAEEQMASDGIRARELIRTLFDGGYSGICFPPEYGGQGLSAEHQRVFLEESAPYEMPVLFNTPTLTICAPTLLDFGTEEQKRQHIPRMLNGEELWVQLLSEPSGGSDLAGVLTRADRDGDRWVLNGSKVWSTGAHRAEYGLCLARTDWDVPKHAGLTMFVVDLHDPKIDISQIKMVNGTVDFCQEFFNDAVLAAGSVVGQPDDGWTVALRLLTHERDATAGGSPYAVGIRLAHQGGLQSGLAELARAAGTAGDPRVRELVAEAWANDVVQDQLNRWVARGVESGAFSGPVTAIPRLFHALVNERAVDIELEIAGAGATVWRDEEIPGRSGVQFLMRQARSLGGGSNEMQRNIISERLLGMPREPAADRGRPYREVRKNAPPAA